MPRLIVSILALGLGVASALGLVSCGDGGSDEGLLPGESASQIVQNLDQVEADAASGDCASAAAAVNEVAEQVDSLPGSVDPELRNNLVEGTQRLVDVVNAPGACEPAITTETDTETTTTETDTETTDTETTETETTDTEPTTTEPTITTETTTEPTTTPTTTTAPSGGVGSGGTEADRSR